MCKFCKAVLKILSILTAIVGALFVVYFWNLDQKLLGWAYVQVNKIFDRKKWISNSNGALQHHHPRCGGAGRLLRAPALRL